MQTPSRYDVLIAGAGLFGSVCAHELNRQGFRCLILEKRNHIGGNCYTESKDGIQLHKYGPHIFHTSNKAIWNWITQFTDFNHYRYHGKVNYEGRIYSFPLNMMTFHQLWGIRTPAEAEEHLERVKIGSSAETNLESWALSRIGREAYEIFIRGYTQKQWGRPPAELPASIIKRIPIRFTYDDNYFDDPFQGIPIGGYTSIFSKLLSGVEVRLATDYLAARKVFDGQARTVLYTGPIDRFFDHRFGPLEYRSLRFEEECLEQPDFQGAALINFTSERIPFTRIIEHKHFEFGSQPCTWITREYPAPASRQQEPFYPIRDEANVARFRLYHELSCQPAYRQYHFGGRLAQYQYFDMHQIIAGALAKAMAISKYLRHA